MTEDMQVMLCRVAAGARGRAVKIIMVNGYQMEARILEIGESWLEVQADTGRQIVMLQAVSTIIMEEGKQ